MPELPTPFPRLLFVSLSVPGQGGSSTAAYDLFRRLREDGAPAQFLNLIEEDRAAYLEIAHGQSLGNPLDLPEVYTHWCERGYWEPQPELTRLIDRLDPTFLIGVGWIAAGVALQVASDRPTILLTGSCRSAQDCITRGQVPDVMTLIRLLDSDPSASFRIHPGELNVYRRCRLVLTHSSQTRMLAERFFPLQVGKINREVFWFAEWICAGAQATTAPVLPFEARDIDLLFIATDWRRPEKNYPLLKALAQRFSHAAVHVVGDAADLPASVVHHGLLTERSDLFSLIGRARCLVCPSRMDAAPGVLFEASALGCNVVASRNCGNWELCHGELLADPCEVDPFERCIRRALERKYPDNLDRFLTPSSYRRLVLTMAAFAQPFESQGVS